MYIANSEMEWQMDIQKEYKRDMYHNYMVIMALEENRFEARMIEENEIAGLMNIQVRSVDNEEYYYYDISSKQPIANLFERGQLGYDQIKSIIGGIVNAVEEGSKYLLSEDDYVLDTQYIYITLSSFSVSLCYLPGYNCNLASQFTQVIEYLMDRADHTDEKAVMLVYSLYKTAKQGCTLTGIKEALEGVNDDVSYRNTVKETEKYPDYSFEDSKDEKYSFSECNDENIEEIKVDNCNEITSANIGSHSRITDVFGAAGGIITGLVIAYFTGFLTDSDGSFNVVRTISIMLSLGAAAGIIIIKIRDMAQSVSGVTNGVLSESNNYIDDYSFETVMDEDAPDGDIDNYEEETILLADYRKKTEIFTLVLMDDDKDVTIKVNELPFIVGKLKDKVDYAIMDEAISRLHAKFDYIDNNQLVVTDLNSKNGTFINGERLLANETRKVNIGDDVGFADLVFNIR